MATAYDTSNIIIPKSAGYKSGSLYGWNPQGGSLVDFAVTRAGATATRVNESGVRDAVAANVPRIDWAEGLACPSLLVEPQRTNIFPQDLSGSGVVTRTITVANATVYSVSVEGTGSMALSGAGTGTVSEGSPVTFTSSSTSLTLTLTGSLDYCQVEAGIYATSIIFTELVQETRNTDVIQKTGIASLLGQNAGSFAIKAKLFDGAGSGAISISANNNTDEIRILFSAAGGSADVFLVKDGAQQIPQIGFVGLNTPSNFDTIALSFATNDFKASANGATAVPRTYPSFNDGDLTTIKFSRGGGQNPFYGRISFLSSWDISFNATEIENIASI